MVVVGDTVLKLVTEDVGVDKGVVVGGTAQVQTMAKSLGVPPQGSPIVANGRRVHHAVLTHIV